MSARPPATPRESDDEFRAAVREEFDFVKEQLGDIKKVLDLLLKASELDEKRAAVEDDEQIGTIVVLP